MSDFQTELRASQSCIGSELAGLEDMKRLSLTGLRTDNRYGNIFLSGSA